ncbi:hypothetical protein B296_00052893 [Ensete ventricosum]|uniref:Uncharacterized protein n=1 Tax=Ensete ventricosum TaxID=4639 RepID=A0A426YAD4_ENSVE|nr:hypothetical protein B296_00052893 [Ensete ventricosum]
MRASNGGAPVVRRVLRPHAVVDALRRPDIVEQEVHPRLLLLQILLQPGHVALEAPPRRRVPLLLLLGQLEELRTYALQLPYHPHRHAMVHQLEDAPLPASIGDGAGCAALVVVSEVDHRDLQGRPTVRGDARLLVLRPHELRRDVVDGQAQGRDGLHTLHHLHCCEDVFLCLLNGKVVGEEGFEPSTPWFVATCFNPLSYRPHPASTGFVPGSTLKKEPFISSVISFRVKKM